MDWRDLVIDGYGRIFELLDPALQAGLGIRIRSSCC